jgi:hypothetical protein
LQQRGIRVYNHGSLEVTMESFFCVSGLRSTVGNGGKVLLSGLCLTALLIFVTICPQLVAAADPVLTVTLAGAGGGSVNSTPAGIACSSGSAAGCSASFTTGSLLTLDATADWKSIFNGWGAPCSGTGSCQITLNGDTGVTATFKVNGQATVLGHDLTEYGSLQDAYNKASNYNIIAAHVYTFLENLNLNMPIIVTLDMGRGSMYLSPAGYSTLQGSLTISQGMVTIKNLIIR